jgi:hypothetical protein
MSDLSSEQLRLFELTHQTANELKQLLSTVQRPQLISALGYAFHVLPEIARSGGWESNSFFQFNFRIAASFWSELPSSMRDTLCRLAGITVWAAAGLVNKRGFAIPWGRRSGQTIPWSEVQIVEDWTDPDAN